ncbi:hypothetical protein [Streptomyces sp. MJM1172]|uniref:hypothetical protein n=1 Tax=Streptomyces sp. MJM1172 TaxID=1703926 RepID=UPI00093C2C41
MPETGHDHRQAGSCFLNPTVTDDQARTLRSQGAPVHRTPLGTWRASTGWLLEACGYRPGTAITCGVSCYTHRTLTLTAQPSATTHSFHSALTTMAAHVLMATGVRLQAEPAAV